MSVFKEGDLVQYQPGGGCRAEQGFVTSVNDTYVFVRFGTDTGSKACDPRDVTRVRVSDMPARYRMAHGFENLPRVTDDQGPW